MIYSDNFEQQQQQQQAASQNFEPPNFENENFTAADYPADNPVHDDDPFNIRLDPGPGTPLRTEPDPAKPALYVPFPDRIRDPDDEFHPKRNSGKTGPLSATGRMKIAQNARKHGACARTLILPGESVKDWETLFSRWQKSYNAFNPDSVLFDFVLKTAQAEWQRIRVQLSYDDFLVSTCSKGLADLNESETKRHDLLLRYKTTAERAFQREFRTLEQYYKTHKPAEEPKPEEPEANAEDLQPEEEGLPDLVIENTATGERVVHKFEQRFPVWRPGKTKRR